MIHTYNNVHYDRTNPELESRPKSSRPRRDTRLKPNVYKMTRIILTLNFR